MTFQGTRGARHGVQPWQKHHYIAKELLRTRRESLRRFWTASRTMKYFMLASYKGMVRILGLCHKNRYYAQCLSRTIGTIRSVVSFSLRSENKEAGQTQESKRRHHHREDLDSEKLDWLVWLSHN